MKKAGLCVCVYCSMALSGYIPVATREEGSRYKLPGFEYVAHVLILSRSALTGAP
jgi:hypothetical protein